MRNIKSKSLTFKKIYAILDEAKSLCDSDDDTIEWIEDEFKDTENKQKLHSTK